MIRTEHRAFRFVAKLLAVTVANLSMPFGFASTVGPVLGLL